MCDFSAHEEVAHEVVLAVEGDHHRAPAPAPPNHHDQGPPGPVHDHTLTPDLDPGNINHELCFIAKLLVV